MRQVSLIGRRYKDTCREVQEWKKKNSEKMEDEGRYGQNEFEVEMDEGIN